MKNNRIGNKNSENSKKNDEKFVEVLYQKLGDRWFAFSLINDEIFVGSISQSDLQSDNDKIGSKENRSKT